jgi:hypothetical protein
VQWWIQAINVSDTSTFTSIKNPTSPTTTFRSIDNQFNDMVLKRFIFFSSLTWRRLGDGNEILVE